MPSAIGSAPHLPSLPVNIALVASGFAVWSVFSLLPIYTQTGAAAHVREAWDTVPFWRIGVPIILLAQAMAAAIGGNNRYLPLWTLGGFFAGVLVVHPAGNDFGMLPLALLFVGLPSYLALLAAGAIGCWLQACLPD